MRVESVGDAPSLENRVPRGWTIQIGSKIRLGIRSGSGTRTVCTILGVDGQPTRHASTKQTDCHHCLVLGCHRVPRWQGTCSPKTRQKREYRKRDSDVFVNGGSTVASILERICPRNGCSPKSCGGMIPEESVASKILKSRNRRCALQSQSEAVQ